MDKDTRPIHDVSEIPANLSDEDMIDFLDERGVSEEFLENTPEAPEEERPAPRTKPINIRFDDFNLQRLKEMAERRNVGYQTLLKTFVTERLYEEEIREGVVFPGQYTRAAMIAATVVQPTLEPSKKQGAGKPRDWQAEAFDFVKENESVVEDEDLDLIVSSRVLKDATGLMLEISNEVKAASKKETFPPARLARMMKGFNKLNTFVGKAFAIHEQKFGKASSEIEELERLWEEATI